MMKKQHKNRSIIFTILEYFSLLIPYVIIMLVNADTYFTKSNKISMSIGCIICIFVAVIIVAKKTQWLKGLPVFIIGLLISILMKDVLDDMTIIFLWGGIGYAVSLFFGKRAKYHKLQYEKHDTAEIFKGK